MPESASVSFGSVVSDGPALQRHLRGAISNQLAQLGIEHRCVESSRKDSTIIRARYVCTNIEISVQVDQSSPRRSTVKCQAFMPWHRRVFMKPKDVKTLEYLALPPYCIAIDDSLRDDARFDSRTWAGWQRVLQQGAGPNEKECGDAI